MKKNILTILCLAVISACSTKEKPTSEAEVESAEEVEFYENAPAPGFDVEGSSIQAIVIADRVMEAMGGRKAWDETRYIKWVFFGFRSLIWDKWEGNVRIENLKDDTKIIVNIHDNTGKVFKDGAEMTNPDSLEVYLTKGKNIWINDSYWLVMPYKLKDSGVTLSYVREDTTEAGRPSYLLELTFKDVGVTPENYYEVWVDSETNLVGQWAYYETHGSVEPKYVNPWEDYKQYGEILLSSNRGPVELTEIEVMESVPEATFQSFEALNL